VRRNGEFVAGELWKKGDPDVVWRSELYDEIADGDEVVIVISAYVPLGPRKEVEGAEALGGGRSAKGIRAAGPRGARVASVVSDWDRVGGITAMLARLRVLGV
jgi:hypothetical protein